MPALGLHAPGASIGPLAVADLIIAVGYDLVEWAPEVWNRDRRTPVLHIDSTAAEVDRDYLAAAELVGEIGDSLRALAEAVGPRPAAHGWSKFRDPALRALERYGDDDAFPLLPQRIVHDLRRALADDDILISDVGVHKLWLSTRFPAARPNTVVIANGLASMGIALPGAIAARLVHPARKVIAVSGDGGFMMNSQELETAKRLGTAFVAVVLVDDRYGVIALNQQRRFGRRFGVDFGNPDFVAYAASFGLPGFRVDRAADLLPTLRRALDLDTPSVVAVPVDSSRSPAEE
jgi:acetolactate synthase-1/2/3 large subunit